MNLNQLRVFETAARLGSFREAARVLFVTQPAVSAQIRTLEDAHGIRLFDRVAGKVHLTEAGETLLHYARRIFALVGEASENLQMNRSLLTGRLSVAANLTSASYHLPTLVARFKTRFPNVFVRVSVMNSEQAADAVLTLDHDVGVVGGRISNKHLVSNVLVNDPMVVILPARHVLAAKKAVKCSALASFPFVLRERGSSARAFAEAMAEKAGFEPILAMEAGSNEAVKYAVEAGIGISILSQASTARDVAAGFLRTVRLVDADMNLRVSLIHHRDRERSPLIREFLKLAA